MTLGGFKNKRTKGGKGGDLGGGGGRERLCSKHIYEILKELIKNKHSKLLQCRRDWSNEASTQGEYYFLEKLFSSCQLRSEMLIPSVIVHLYRQLERV